MASEDTHQDIASNLGLPEGCSVAGVDAARHGWVVVVIGKKIEALAGSTFEDVLALTRSCDVVGVDIPIGLPEVVERGGRTCDRMARERLGKRSSTVFSPPPRSVLNIEDYQEALAVCREESPDGLGISIQAFNILPRIREVDDSMSVTTQSRVVEIHPELAFSVLNREPILISKHELEGKIRRRVLLERFYGVDLPETPAGIKASEDDLLDACAVAASATRVALNEHIRLPETPHTDSRGLRLEINF